MDLSFDSVPSGDISVMPQAWITSMPNSSSSVRIIAGGQAEPPITVRLRVLKLSLFCLAWLISPSQTVGTPALKVTFSPSSSSCRDLPSRCGPGNTSLAPTIGAAYGTPQALTWNIGTTGRITSLPPTPMPSGSARP